MSAARKRLAAEEGVALLLVLVVIVLSIGSVYAFARTALLSVMAQQQRGDRVRAELMARSAVHIAVRALQDDLSLPGDSAVVRCLTTGTLV